MNIKCLLGLHNYNIDAINYGSMCSVINRCCGNCGKLDQKFIDGVFNVDTLLNSKYGKASASFHKGRAEVRYKVSTGQTVGIGDVQKFNN